MPLSFVKTDVEARFPELTAFGLSDPQWTQFISDANQEITITSWLDQPTADRAGENLVAHMATLENVRATVGVSAILNPNQLQTVTVGPITKTWAALKAAENANDPDGVLDLTIYGREYRRLRKLFCRGR